MISKISSTKELESAIRQHLSKQGAIPLNNVLNSLSVFGTTLDRELSTDIFDSYNTSDIICVFELKPRKSESDVSYTDENDNVIKTSSYTVHCILYGDDAPDYSNVLIARFRTEEVRQSLYDSGVYLESVEEGNSITEFKNEVLWVRYDFDILISCEILITKRSKEFDFEIIDFNVKEK